MTQSDIPEELKQRMTEALLDQQYDEDELGKKAQLRDYYRKHYVDVLLDVLASHPAPCNKVTPADDHEWPKPCSWCDPSFTCFDGSAPCSKQVPADVVHDSAETEGQRPAGTSNALLDAVAAIVANDSFAITFQSLGQYRIGLLRELNALRAQSSPQPEPQRPADDYKKAIVQAAEIAGRFASYMESGAGETQPGNRLRQVEQAILALLIASPSAEPRRQEAKADEEVNQLALAHEAIWTMAEDGWLFCGPEGYSEPQRLLHEYTKKYSRALTQPSPKPSQGAAELIADYDRMGSHAIGLWRKRIAATPSTDSPTEG